MEVLPTEKIVAVLKSANGKPEQQRRSASERVSNHAAGVRSSLGVGEKDARGDV